MRSTESSTKSHSYLKEAKNRKKEGRPSYFESSYARLSINEYLRSLNTRR